MAKQFERVDSKYGAPMGRHSFGEPGDAKASIRLFKMKMQDGYDDGGAYWGYPDNIWVATRGDDYLATVRADKRERAAALLELKNHTLKMPVKPIGKFYIWKAGEKFQLYWGNENQPVGEPQLKYNDAIDLMLKMIREERCN